MLVSASILNKDIKPNVLVNEVNKTDADYLHLDIMDGHFVKNKTWTYSEILKITKNNTKKLDVHLMVNNPTKYIENYALLNTEYITFHYEAVKNIEETISLIKNYGIKVGISIKPTTSTKHILPYLKDIDLILFMSVNPGKSGQKFNDKVLTKISEVKEYINNNHLNTSIEVDGGINNENIDLLKTSGTDIVVSASFIHDGDMQEKINLLR